MFEIQASEGYRHIGIGYKSKYFSQVMAPNRDIGWLEIHAENFMIEGGPRKAMMLDLAQCYPISCHGVGLSIGSEKGLDTAHLERLKTLIDWLNPAVFSEHLAWSSHGNHYYNDLLPLPYKEDVLARVCEHINQIQEALSRTMLLENPSTYIAFSNSEMSEIDFIKEVIRRTGCGLLLDVNNVFVSANNQNYNPYDYINDFPMQAVGEIHLGGHASDFDDKGNPLLIDSHNNPVVDAVWTLYRYTLDRCGAVPTLIEWDNDLPQWDVLIDETRRAAEILQPHLVSAEMRHAC